MTEYYGEVSVVGASVKTENKYFSAGLSTGYGSCRSNDLEIARNLSEGLTEAVDHAVGYAHEINKRSR